MRTSNWLNGKPDINGDIMVSGTYDSVRDDTTHYDVFSYPEGKHLGKFLSSRFKPGVACDGVVTYEMHPKDADSYSAPKFTVWRKLFPDMSGEKRWLELVHWGFPSLVRYRSGDVQVRDKFWKYEKEYRFRIVEDPLPFDDIVNEITEKYKETYEEKT